MNERLPARPHRVRLWLCVVPIMALHGLFQWRLTSRLCFVSGRPWGGQTGSALETDPLGTNASLCRPLTCDLEQGMSSLGLYFLLCEMGCVGR